MLSLYLEKLNNGSMPACSLRSSFLHLLSASSPLRRFLRKGLATHSCSMCWKVKVNPPKDCCRSWWTWWRSDFLRIVASGFMSVRLNVSSPFAAGGGGWACPCAPSRDQQWPAFAAALAVAPWPVRSEGSSAVGCAVAGSCLWRLPVLSHSGRRSWYGRSLAAGAFSSSESGQTMCRCPAGPPAGPGLFVSETRRAEKPSKTPQGRWEQWFKSKEGSPLLQPDHTRSLSHGIQRRQGQCFAVFWSFTTNGRHHGANSPALAWEWICISLLAMLKHGLPILSLWCLK